MHVCRRREIIRDPESYIFLSYDGLDFSPIDVVGETWIVFPEVHDLRFSRIDFHLPILRPFRNSVDPLLHLFLALLLIVLFCLDFLKCFCVIREEENQVFIATMESSSARSSLWQSGNQLIA